MKTPGISLIRAALCLLALLVTCAMAPGEEEKPKRATLDQPAPDFTLKDTKDQPRSLSAYKDRILVVEWVNPECPYVKRHYRQGSMQETYRRVKSLDKSIVWLAIDSTHSANAGQIQFWIERHRVPYPVLLDPDGAVGRLYDSRSTPHMFVIDTKGVLRYHGAIDDNALGTKKQEDVNNYVVNAVRQLVNEETVSPSYVKPYGCSVKFKPPAP